MLPLARIGVNRNSLKVMTMRSFSVYFLRTHKIETSQKLFRSLKALPNCPWVQGSFFPDDSPPADPVLLGEATLAVTPSATVGEVIFLYGDTREDWQDLRTGL